MFRIYWRIFLLAANFAWINIFLEFYFLVSFNFSGRYLHSVLMIEKEKDERDINIIIFTLYLYFSALDMEKMLAGTDSLDDKAFVSSGTRIDTSEVATGDWELFL